MNSFRLHHMNEIVLLSPWGTLYHANKQLALSAQEGKEWYNYLEIIDIETLVM